MILAISLKLFLPYIPASIAILSDRVIRLMLYLLSAGSDRIYYIPYCHRERQVECRFLHSKNDLQNVNQVTFVF